MYSTIAYSIFYILQNIVVEKYDYIYVQYYSIQYILYITVYRGRKIGEKGKLRIHSNNCCTMKTTVYSVQTCQQALILLKMALHFQVLSVTMTLHQSGAYCNKDIAVRWLLKQCHCSQVLGVTMTLQSGDWCNNDNAVRCLLSQRKCSQVLSATMTLYVVVMCKVYQCHCNHVLVQNSYIRVRCLVQR